jgi:N-acetylglucosamine repressor
MSQPADRRLLRAINRAVVMREVLWRGPVSKAAISRATGLSHVTVGSIAGELPGRGLLREGELAPSQGGRPATLLELASDAFHSAGIWLTDSGLVGMVTNLRAEPVVELTRPLDDRDPVGVVATVGSLVDDLLSEAGLARRTLLGIGIGMAGVVDGDEGVCRTATYLDWRDVPLALLGRQVLALPVCLDNDVNALAMSERWFGAARDVEHFLLVTLGTTIGLGIVTDGRVYRGSSGGAGQFGHVVVDDSSRRCSCGNVGCLGAAVTHPELIEAARTMLRARGESVTSPEEMYACARDDTGLRRLIEEASAVLGRGLANLVNIFAPELVVLKVEIPDGGGLLGPLRQELDRHVFPALNGYRMELGTLTSRAWARGAASLVLQGLFDVSSTGNNAVWDRLSRVP